ncbi:TPA: hypothetical protein ACT2ET_000941 [Streptococcus suis]
MAEIISKPLDLSRIVEVIRGTGFPCFGLDMGRDEVADNPSFFLYSDDGGLTPGTHANQYKRAFTVMFVTRERASFDDVGLIERLKDCRLIFDRSEIDKGNLVNTDEQVTATTLNFHQLIRIER